MQKSKINLPLIFLLYLFVTKKTWLFSITHKHNFLIYLLNIIFSTTRSTSKTYNLNLMFLKVFVFSFLDNFLLGIILFLQLKKLLRVRCSEVSLKPLLTASNVCSVLRLCWPLCRIFIIHLGWFPFLLLSFQFIPIFFYRRIIGHCPSELSIRMPSLRAALVTRLSTQSHTFYFQTSDPILNRYAHSYISFTSEIWNTLTYTDVNYFNYFSRPYTFSV